MRPNRHGATRKFRTGYPPPTSGSHARHGAPRFLRGLRPSDRGQETDADILGAVSVLAFAPAPARLTVLGEITAAGRRCWAYSRTLFAEWRRRARTRNELVMLNDRQLSDIRLSRSDALNEASKPFWRE